MSKTFQLSRRAFLQATGMSLGGLILGVPLHAEETTQSLEPNLFVVISPNNEISLVCHRSEMGQGIRTSVCALLAEELDLPMERFNIVQAAGDAKYGDQNTDGSRSIRRNFDRLRLMGAQARDLLEQAACLHFKVKAQDLEFDDASVLVIKTAQSISFGDLVPIVLKNQLKVKEKPALKPANRWRYIGKVIPLKDVPAMVDGSAEFGIDVSIPGKVYASIEQAPVLGSSVESHNASTAKEFPGVMDVISLPGLAQPVNTNAGLAVIATNTWAAFEGRKQLVVNWTDSEYDGWEMDVVFKDMHEACEQASIEVHKAGDVSKFEAKDQVEAVYSTPVQVHAPMEPLNATARVVGEKCEVWAPTQDPQRARKAIAAYLKVPEENITINITFLGGGFGRKSQPDFLLQAVQLAKELNKPVQVVWTREDEIKHGFYHAPSVQKLKAGLDENGKIQSWEHNSVFPTIMKVFDPSAKSPASWEIGMGATNLPYDIKNQLIKTHELDFPVRIGWMRAVCHVFQAYAINSFLDEVCVKINQDPIDYRLSMLKGEGDTQRRLRDLLNFTRTQSNWNQRRKQGAKLGFASHDSFGSFVSAVVEVSGTSLEDFKITEVDVCIDLGRFVNRDSIVSQMEGSVVFAISSTLYQKVMVSDGKVSSSNFHDSQIARHMDSPIVRVHIMENEELSGGAGEPGVPAVVPAITNAIYAATGKRVRDLPLRG